MAKKTTVKRKSPQKRGLNKAVVVQAAADLADEVGLERLSIAMLADRLGVRPPSLYNHVENLDDLYSQLSIKGAKDLTAAIKLAVSSTSKEKSVLAMAGALRSFAKENPTLYYCTSRAQTSPGEEFAQAGAALLELTTSTFQELKLSKKRAETAHYFLRCLLAGFVSLEASNGLQPAEDTDEVFRKVMDFALKALRS